MRRSPNAAPTVYDPARPHHPRVGGGSQSPFGGTPPPTHHFVIQRLLSVILFCVGGSWCFLAVLGGSWRSWRFGASSLLLGAPWGLLGDSLGALGCVLGTPWGSWGAPWGPAKRTKSSKTFKKRKKKIRNVCLLL